MSNNLEWKTEGWQQYETVEAAMVEAAAAADRAPIPTLPTIFQTKDPEKPYTFGLTGWDTFRATLMQWPMILLWHRGEWRESFTAPPWAID